MSTIAGLSDGTTVWLAADSMTNVYERPVHTATKVTVVPVEGGTTAVLGVAGDGAVAQLVLVLPLPHPDDLDGWANEVAVHVTEQCVRAGLTDAGRMSSNLLLGYQGRLWTLVHHQAIAHTDPPVIAALGSGEGFAMGYMHAHLDRSAHAPLRLVVEAAVEVAARYDKHTDDRVTVVSA